MLVTLLVRPLWIWPATYLPRRLSARVARRDPTPPWQEVLALSWAGMRGVVSLAAAFALPLATEDGRPFPQRDLLLFLVFVVILTTLLLQGLTYGRRAARARAAPRPAGPAARPGGRAAVGGPGRRSPGSTRSVEDDAERT